MQFCTVRRHEMSTEEYDCQEGPGRGYFVFDYEVSHDPTIEGVAVQIAPDVRNSVSWNFEPDIQVGAQIGWDDARLEDGVRLCCTKLHILGVACPSATRLHIIRSLLIHCVQRQIVAWAEPIPPLRAEWLTSDVIALARGIHANAALDGLPALTDALLEAGCDDPLVIDHLLMCPDHAPSCWVVEMILDQLSVTSSTP
jgi:hypothetical protein